MNVILNQTLSQKNRKTNFDNFFFSAPNLTLPTLMFVYMCSWPSFWSKKENYLTLRKFKIMETGNRWSVYTSLYRLFCKSPIYGRLRKGSSHVQKYFWPIFSPTLSSVLESKVKIICQTEGRSYLLSQNVNKLSRIFMDFRNLRFPFKNCLKVFVICKQTFTIFVANCYKSKSRKSWKFVYIVTK